MTLTSKKCTSRISLKFKEHKQAAAIFSALEPEVLSLDKAQGDSGFNLKRNTIVLDLESDDISAVRASINSYIRLTYAAFRCTTV